MTTLYTNLLDLLYQSYDEPEEQLVKELISFYKDKSRYHLLTIIERLEQEYKQRSSLETSKEWHLNTTLFLSLLNKEFPQYDWIAETGKVIRFKGANKGALPNSQYMQLEADNLERLERLVFIKVDNPSYSFIKNNNHNVELISKSQWA